jgi:alpha-L-fucosidase 2
MCYQPAYHGNRLENLLPLFDMVLSWETQLRHNARVFLGIEDGVMLPHAVDDRCMCMTGFWTGSIDHACTAWVALMMYRYYRYSMDKDFLRRAYPFMVAAMRVYEEMIEKDGSALCLPVSVSPEYRGAQMNAWGKNASFQLACIHSLCESLTDASRALRKKPRAVWARIMAKLPKASLVGKQGDDTIALWEGTSLEETHRHHSHLGSITPFDTIDPEAPEWRSIIRRSLREWVLRGTGRWSGWCLTWASTINSHVGNPEAAVHFIEVFDRFFTNEGGGTVHDPCVPGFTLPICGGNAEENDDIMQMDGGMGAVTAVQEMFLHTRRGVNHLFAGAPRNWKDTSFSGMRTDGAFLVSARRKRGVVADVKVKSLAGGTFKVANPWGGPVRVIRKGMADRIVRGKTLKIATKAAENMVLRAGA